LGIEESFLNKWDSVVKYKIAGGDDILQFNLGQPNFACPDFVKKIIEETSGKEKNNFYTHTGGTEKAREAVAMFQEKMFDLAYERDEVIITNGAKESLFLAFAAILNPSDEVIIIAPYWSSYTEQVKFLGAVPVIVSVKRDFHLDVEAIKNNITGKTRVIVINSPNNPSGMVYGKDELLEVSELAIKNGLIVVSDEVYGSTVFDGKEHVSIASLPGMKERSVLIDGFSKTLSMAGYRLGYAMSSKEMISAMIKIKSNINGNTNSFFQLVLEDALLNHFDDLMKFIDDTRNEYQSRRDFLCKSFDEMGIEFIRPEGTFYIFAKVPPKLNMKSKEFADHLLESIGVAVAPGIFFGKTFDDHFRLSFGASMESLEDGMERMKNFLS